MKFSQLLTGPLFHSRETDGERFESFSMESFLLIRKLTRVESMKGVADELEAQWKLDMMTALLSQQSINVFTLFLTPKYDRLINIGAKSITR